MLLRRLAWRSVVNATFRRVYIGQEHVSADNLKGEVSAVRQLQHTYIHLAKLTISGLEVSKDGSKRLEKVLFVDELRLRHDSGEPTEEVGTDIARKLPIMVVDLLLRLLTSRDPLRQVFHVN